MQDRVIMLRDCNSLAREIRRLAITKQHYMNSKELNRYSCMKSDRNAYVYSSKNINQVYQTQYAMLVLAVDVCWPCTSEMMRTDVSEYETMSHWWLLSGKS